MVKLVPSLYRALLRAAKEFHTNESQKKSLYVAVRSCTVAPYDGIREDWKHEQTLRQHIDGMTPHDIIPWKQVVQSIRKKFVAESKIPMNERIDRGFGALRSIGNHNDLIQFHSESNAFDPKRRTDEIVYRVGDLVRIEGIGRGVVCAWHVPRLKYRSRPPKYVVLAHCRRNNDQEEADDELKLYHVDDTRLKPSKKAEPISNAWLSFFFDGFEDGRHIPCSALALKYPEDVVEISNPQTVPSILELQNAEEPELVKYLQCSDATVVQISKAVLEAKWMAEAGPRAKRDLETAMEIYASGEKDEGRRRMKKVVAAYPSYASAIEMLAIATLDDEKTEESLKLFQKVLELKPYHLRALSGLATSAAKLKQWDVAHCAAAKLNRLEPNSSIAKRVLSKVDEALYYML